MICPNCGFTNAAGDEFCGSCGQYLWTEGTETGEEAEGGSPAAGTAPTEVVSGTAIEDPEAEEPAAGDGGADQRVEGGFEGGGEGAPPGAAAGAGARSGGSFRSDATGGAGADPYAQTRTIPSSLQRCWNCGTANEATRTFCQSCGQQLKQARTRRWRAVPGAAAVAGEGAQASGLEEAAPVPADRRRRYLLVGGGVAALALLLIVGAVVAGMLGDKRDVPPDETQRPTAVAATVGPAGVPPTDPPGPDTPAPAGPTTAPSAPGQPTPTPAVGERFRCETQSVGASEPGRWQVYRARWGSRSGHDYLSLQLRRRGGSDEVAGATAELVPLPDVEGRYGVAPPNRGDVAIVVSFSGPVTLSGSFGRNPGQRALQDFRVVRRGGVTYAVIGINGSGCFELTAPGWTGGSGAISVTLDIGR